MDNITRLCLSALMGGFVAFIFFGIGIAIGTKNLDSTLGFAGLFSWPFWIILFWFFMPKINSWMEKKSF